MCVRKSTNCSYTFSITSLPSFHNTPMNNAGNKLKKLNCTFLTHNVALDPLRTFSKYTPAAPESMHAEKTVTNPNVGLTPSILWLGVWAETARVWNEKCLWKKPSSFVVSWAGSWTSATPNVRRTNETHFCTDNWRWSSVTLKSAVVRILSWYVTWKVAASRFDTATYWRLFCSCTSQH